MPGCHTRVRSDSVSLLIGTANSAEFALPIPNTQSLVGLRYYQQVFVPDPAANALGGVVSDAAEALVGQ